MCGQSAGKICQAGPPQMPEFITRCRKQAAGIGRGAPGLRERAESSKGAQWSLCCTLGSPSEIKGPFPLVQEVLPTQPQLSTFWGNPFG